MASNSDTKGGTGDKFSRVAITICGIAALIASLLTLLLVGPIAALKATANIDVIGQYGYSCKP